MALGLNLGLLYAWLLGTPLWVVVLGYVGTFVVYVWATAERVRKPLHYEESYGPFETLVRFDKPPRR